MTKQGWQSRPTRTEKLAYASRIIWTVVRHDSPAGSHGLNQGAYTDVPAHEAKTKSRIIDLDVDIGADAVDYKYVPPPTSHDLFFFF
jgi:hypothetical protein